MVISITSGISAFFYVILSVMVAILYIIGEFTMSFLYFAFYLLPHSLVRSLGFV